QAPTALVTEGLLGYFDLAAVEGMWRRFARALRGRGGGVYLTDFNLGGDADLAARAFRHALSWFAQGTGHLHFDGPEGAAAALRAAGFDQAQLRQPSEFAEVDVPRRWDGHQVRIGIARVCERFASRPRGRLGAAGAAPDRRPRRGRASHRRLR